MVVLIFLIVPSSQKQICQKVVVPVLPSKAAKRCRCSFERPINTNHANIALFIHQNKLVLLPISLNIIIKLHNNKTWHTATRLVVRIWELSCNIFFYLLYLYNQQLPTTLFLFEKLKHKFQHLFRVQNPPCITSNLIIRFKVLP